MPDKIFDEFQGDYIFQDGKCYKFVRRGITPATDLPLGITEIENCEVCLPTVAPTTAPTTVPPTVIPTVPPTMIPTVVPTVIPTVTPTTTVAPTTTVIPTVTPTTVTPTITPTTVTPTTLIPTTVAPTTTVTPTTTTAPLSCECAVLSAQIYFCAESLGVSGLVDDDPVNIWDDLSSAGNDGTPDTTLPTYKTNIVNGKPVVRFDSDDNIVVPTNAGLNITNQHTMFIVFVPQNIGAEFMSKGTVFDGFRVKSNGGGVGTITIDMINSFFDWSSWTSNNNIGLGAFHLLTIRHNSTTIEMWFDGVAQPLTQFDAGSGFNGTIGANYNVSLMEDLAFPAPGTGNGVNYGTDLAEFAMFNTALSDVERQSIENCLISRYNL
jgi:hypothetical protein